MPQSPLCFINYRRLDSGGHAAHLKDKLARWFDPQYLFFDTHSLDYGDDFPESIAEKIACTNALLVVIGPGWLAQLKRYQIAQKTDWVKLELLQALARYAQGESLAIIPVLVGGATLPDAALLPSELRSLVQQHGRHAISVATTGEEFDQAFQSLLRCLEQHGLPPARFRQPDGVARPFHVMGRIPSVHFHDPLAHLDSLRLVLDQEKTAALLTGALHGMGGVGKTQLALQYSHAFQTDYAGVWWLRAEDPLLLELDCLQMAEANRIPHEKGKPVAPAIRQWLAAQPPWLLVYDNAEDVAVVKPYLPDRGHHHVLITSRRPDWQALAGAHGCIHLAHWTAEQALGFLVKRLPHQDVDALRHIAIALGGLPLALEQAAAYMDATQLAAAEYCQLLADSAEQATLLNKTQDADEKTVLKTLSLSLAKLSKPTRQLLDLCAVCAPEPIPEDLFQAHSDLLYEPLKESCAGLDWVSMVQELRRFALAERSAEQRALTLHRLTQAAARLSEPPARQAGLHLLRLLGADFPKKPEMPEYWPRCGILLPHIRNLGQFDELGTQDAGSYGWLLSETGVYLRAGLAKYQDAGELIGVGLGICKDINGADHQMTLAIKTELGTTLCAQGDFAGAKRVQEQVLETHTQRHGPENPATLTAMNNLALTLKELGDWNGAKALLREALAVEIRTLGISHETTLHGMNNLAGILHMLGDLSGAREQLEQVYTAQLATFGQDHPLTLSSMGNLAAILSEQGELERAKSLQEAALEIRKRLFGPEHPETLLCMHNLAQTLLDLGETNEAYDLDTKALAIQERLLGPEHPDTLFSMNRTAVSTRQLGDLDSAEKMHRKVLVTRTRTLGPEHPDTLGSMATLAATLWHQEKLEEAHQLQHKALEARKRLLGTEHRDTLESMNSLATILGQMGDWRGAIQLQEEILPILIRDLGQEHTKTLISMNNIADALRNLEDFVNAEKMFRKILAVRKRKLGVEHPDTTVSAWNLFLTLYQMDNQRAAQAVLSQDLVWLMARDPATFGHAQGMICEQLVDYFKHMRS